MRDPLDSVPLTPIRRPLQLLIKEFSTPLIIAAGDPSKPDISGGTALFWETSLGRYLVTAGHVAQRMIEIGAVDAPSGFCVVTGSKSLSLRGGSAVINPDCDLAVIHLPALARADLLGKSFYRAREWPPQPAREGETLGMIGYPGGARSVAGTKVIPESIYMERDCFLSGSGRWLQLGNADDVMMLEKSKEGAPLFNDLGGMSGAPVFALRDGEPVWVGVVSERIHDRGLASVLRAAHSGFITEAGQILA